MRDPLELHPTDLETHLGALASQLRLRAHALRGIVALEGAPTSPEGRELVELADELRRIAAHLDFVQRGLCESCRLSEVTETLAE